jgi:hypothetical protein
MNIKPLETQKKQLEVCLHLLVTLRGYSTVQKSQMFYYMCNIWKWRHLKNCIANSEISCLLLNIFIVLKYVYLALSCHLCIWYIYITPETIWHHFDDPYTNISHRSHKSVNDTSQLKRMIVWVFYSHMNMCLTITSKNTTLQTRESMINY